ncbi:MAG: class I SAM-dependent methyltransferase [Pyrinomonadaceae bacterium]
MGETLLKTKFYVPPTETQLSMTRVKPRPMSVGLMYRLFHAGQALFGAKKMTKLALNASRLFARFAFELSSASYGESFHNVSIALSEEVLSRHIPSGGTVLDVGCGYGRACRMAAKFAASVIGIDHDGKLLETARTQTSEKNVEFVHGDITTELGGQKFDLVLLLHVIEHIEEPNRLLQTLHGISNKIVVEVPDFESDPLNLVRFDLGLQFYSDGDHVREYTEKILTDQLTRNGWTPIELRKKGGAVLAVAEAA